MLDESQSRAETQADLIIIDTGPASMLAASEVHAKAVIITGVGAFEPSKLELPNAERYVKQKQKHHYFVSDLQQFHGKHVLIPYEIIELYGEERIERLTLMDTKSKQFSELPVNTLISNYGFSSALGPIEQWGLAIKGGSIIVDF